METAPAYDLFLSYSRRDLAAAETLLGQAVAVAMYTLREHIGDEPLSRALRGFLEKHRNSGPPYPTSRDLLAALRAVTPGSLQYLLTDLFETITLWDVRTQRAIVERTDAGEYRVTLDVAGRKMRADSVGRETETPMDDLVEIGVFASGEGDGLGAPLYLQRHRIRSGKQTLRITVPREPGRAGSIPIASSSTATGRTTSSALEFEANTFWELETGRATAKQTAAGTWQVTLEVLAPTTSALDLGPSGRLPQAPAIDNPTPPGMMQGIRTIWVLFSLSGSRRAGRMIRITKQTDYGIVLLTHLAATPERHVNAPELAGETRLPLPMVSKILKVLVREGVLLSHRGVKGGYSLARPPQEISMAEVITALEGPVAITECIDEDGGCSHEPFCAVRGRWHRINEALREALAGINLAEMAHPPQAPQKLVTLGRGGTPAGAPVHREAEPVHS